MAVQPGERALYVTNGDDRNEVPCSRDRRRRQARCVATPRGAYHHPRPGDRQRHAPAT
jgi:hypothetical protein